MAGNLADALQNVLNGTEETYMETGKLEIEMGKMPRAFREVLETGVAILVLFTGTLESGGRGVKR